MPASVARSRRPATSQSLTVRSAPPEASVRPSGENATDRTEPPWPSRLASSFPAATSQSLTCLSYPPDARSRPSGEKATE